MAVSSVVITVEGVLQKNVSYAPIPVGISLYHGLLNTFNVLLVADATKEELDHWLSIEGLSRHAGVEYNDNIRNAYSQHKRRVDQVSAFQKRGYAIDLVIEPDPACAAALLGRGFTVANFLHHAYALPQWRPDYTQRPRPWDEMEKNVNYMAQLRANDTRLRESETR